MVGNILGECLFVSVSTIWCISLLEYARAILSVKNGIHLYAQHEMIVPGLYLQVFENSVLYVPPFSRFAVFPFALSSSSLIVSNHGGEL